VPTALGAIVFSLSVVGPRLMEVCLVLFNPVEFAHVD